MNRAGIRLRLLPLLLILLIPLPCLAIPAETIPPPDPHLNESKPTTILVRVVAHGSMVLGKDVGGARVTITDVASGKILASGLQQGDAGDQNQIMRTPRLMGEPLYSSRASAAFTTTLELNHPNSRGHCGRRSAVLSGIGPACHYTHLAHSWPGHDP